MGSGTYLLTLGIALLISIIFFSQIVRTFCSVLGYSLRSRTTSRRQLLLERASKDEIELARKDAEGTNSQLDGEWEKVESSSTPSSGNGEKATRDWEGVIGFFHPFCNAGGGGERVLWAAIRATQRQYPNALCIVYTGDHEVDKDLMLGNVKNRFNIDLHAPRITFLYLSTRHFVLASKWPHFTLLGQSFGSLILAWDAFNLLVPDIFIDTMGYGFTLAFCKLLFPTVAVGAYVHYPTISTDMLQSLDDDTSTRGVNAGLGKGLKGKLKRQYWQLFARLYSWAGGSVDVVMTNSSWTQNHVMQLWGPSRKRNGKASDIEVVFPPVAVEELADTMEVSEKTEQSRQPDVLYISQFRPEKNHQLIITAFAEFMRNEKKSKQVAGNPRLVLVGSVRDDADKMLVYKLRVLAREQGIADNVEFVVNAKWAQILDWLRSSSVGANGMWNEHFGIGVVEYQAAGLISVVNDSGGPKEDIVVEIDGQPTGFHASTAAEFAAGFAKALSLSPEEALAMRKRARKSALRFTEDEFRVRWLRQLQKPQGLRSGRKA